MKGQRVSIGRMMVVVMLVAVNFGLIRWSIRIGSEYFLIVILSMGPTFSFLALALLLIGLDLRRRGESSSFATGYLLVGGFFSGLAVFLSVREGLLYRLVFYSTHILSDAINTGRTAPLAMSDNTLMLEFSGVMIGFAIPQVIPGLIAGWLARRYGLMLVLRGRHQKSTERSSKV